MRLQLYFHFEYVVNEENIRIISEQKRIIKKNTACIISFQYVIVTESIKRLEVDDISNHKRNLQYTRLFLHLVCNLHPRITTELCSGML